MTDRPLFPCEHEPGCGRVFGGYRAYRDAHPRGRCLRYVRELRAKGLHETDGVWARPDPTNSQAVLFRMPASPGADHPSRSPGRTLSNGGDSTNGDGEAPRAVGTLSEAQTP